MLEMSWIAAFLQLYSQVADLFGNVIVKRINMRLFYLLARFHYILNLPRTPPYTPLYSKTGVYRGKHNFLIFALKYRLWVLVRTASVKHILLAVLTCYHNLCFEQK